MNEFYLSVVIPGTAEMVQECTTLESAEYNRKRAIDYYNGVCDACIFQFQETGDIYNPLIRIPVKG